MPNPSAAYILREKLPLQHTAQNGRQCELRMEILGHHGARLYLDVGGPGPYHLGTFDSAVHLERALYSEGLRLDRGHIGSRFLAALVRDGRAIEVSTESSQAAV